MGITTHSRNMEKVALFRELFTGLTEVYGTFDCDSGQACMVKASVTDKVIYKHLKGELPYGVYLLTGDRTRAVVTDFDIPNPLPCLEFIRAAEHYGLPAYLERSKSKGHHCWIFLDQAGASAAKARCVVQCILEEIEQPQTEIFPKHDRLGNGVRYGNFIHAPLFGALVPEGRTVYLSPDSMKPFEDQWIFLESVERVSESALDEIIEVNELSVSPGDPSSHRVEDTKVSSSFPALPPCSRRILQEGVTANQRVTCFRLAVHLKRVGLPLDLTVAVLNTWAQKNRPQEGKRVITQKEIEEQTAYAFNNGYRGLGCEEAALQPYCDPQCPVYRWKSNGSGSTEIEPQGGEKP